MKKLFPLLILLLPACNHPGHRRASQEESLQPAKYFMKIKQDQMDVSGTMAVPVIKTDTIIATSDSAAYARAVNTWYATLKAEKMTKNLVSTSHSFIVTDSAGADLVKKLPKDLTDTINVRTRAMVKQLNF